MPDSLRWAIKILLVGSVTASSVAAFQAQAPMRAASSAGLAGAWGVTAFTRDAAATDPTAGPAWRRLIVDDDSLVIRLDDEAFLRSSAATAAAARCAGPWPAPSCNWTARFAA
jgi:hypothetical protein